MMRANWHTTLQPPSRIKSFRRESAHPKDVPPVLVDTGVDRHHQPRDMSKRRLNLKQFDSEGEKP
jgi:hypothetical protein